MYIIGILFQDKCYFKCRIMITVFNIIYKFSVVIVKSNSLNKQSHLLGLKAFRFHSNVF